ncbi:MAG: extensin family protein [Octadecabacter sp.]
MKLLATVLSVAVVLSACSRKEPEIDPQFGPGNVCGDPALFGEAIGTVDGAGACGVADAVRLTAVSGVTLSTPATINCATATALKSWVEDGVRPAVGDTGGGVQSLRVVAHYSCRSRNNQSGARLSEHSFGNAIDIAGIGLADGSEMTVLTGWNGQYARQLRQMWQAACGPFGTVLGPEADRFHRDHFHFDTADYRSGSFCR